MCGRYAQSRDAHELQLEFDFDSPEAGSDRDPKSWPPLEELQPDYNIAPGKTVYAVLGDPQRDEPGEHRSLGTLRWGLVPTWAKDPNIGYKMINARAETVADKPAYRRAFAKRRCLIPADAYYEWQLVPRDSRQGTPQASTSPATDPEHRTRKSRAAKRPFAIRYADGRPLAFAGLFERWQDPTRDPEDPRRWLWSCTIITTEAAPGLAEIHERMPVILPRTDFAAWLDPSTDATDLQEILQHTPAAELETHPVGTAVNSVRNNGPELLNAQASEQDTPGLW